MSQSQPRPIGECLVFIEKYKAVLLNGQGAMQANLCSSDRAEGACRKTTARS